MNTEDKELLLKDLCARLQYGVKGKVYAEVSNGKYDMWGEMIFYDAPFDVTLDGINTSTEEIHVVAIGNEDTVEFIEMQQTDGAPYTIDEFKPYLRPMSSMTKEEKAEYKRLCVNAAICNDYQQVDYLNSNYFDYHGLIPKGLALEASEGMYKSI